MATVHHFRRLPGAKTHRTQVVLGPRLALSFTFGRNSAIVQPKSYDIVGALGLAALFFGGCDRFPQRDRPWAFDDAGSVTPTVRGPTTSVMLRAVAVFLRARKRAFRLRVVSPFLRILLQPRECATRVGAAVLARRYAGMSHTSRCHGDSPDRPRCRQSSHELSGVFRFARRGARVVLPLSMLLLVLGGCTQDLARTRQENASVVLSAYRTRPLAAVNNGQSLVGLHDCVRVALENSLDIQVAIWEERARADFARSARVRMLPRNEWNYELSTRDRPQFSRSDLIDHEGQWEVSGPAPGSDVTNFSTGRERFQRPWNTQLKWSPIDSCMARFLCQVKNNEATHARYQRVRVAQQLTGTVTAAFYRLLALSEALPKARDLEANRQSILADLQKLGKNALVDPQEVITARAQLTEASSTLADTMTSIGRQRELLAAAMNVSPESHFQLAGALMPLPAICLDTPKLEAAALVNRPETFQADLSHMSSVADYKRLIVKLIPRAEGFIGYFRDENKFILNKNWTEGGLRVTWDAMDFVATMLERRSSSDRVVKTDHERALISLGILSQVKLKTIDAMRALDKLRKTSEQLDQAREGMRVAREIEEAKQQGAPPSEKAIRIARQKALCGVIQVEIDRINALGEVHAAFADLEAAVGTNYPVSAADPPTRHGLLRKLGLCD
jgi:outer membrane protein TolC